MNQEHTGNTGSANVETRTRANEGRRQRTAGSNDETASAVRDAYEKTSKAVQAGYQRTIEYGNDHPQRFGLLTFAAGFAAGSLVVAMGLLSRHTRTERIASPLIDGIAEVARALIRR